MSSHTDINFEHIKGPESKEEFITFSVNYLGDSIIEKLKSTSDKVILALSGGSTPVPVYNALTNINGEFEYARSIDWNRIIVILVDERYVDTSDSNANSKLVIDTFGRVVPKNQIITPPVDNSLNVSDCAAKYGSLLKELFKNNGPPSILLLGMGPDGHIASLFPTVDENDALNENSFYISTTAPDQFAIKERMSMTWPVITSASRILFLLRGEGKKNVWNEMLSSNETRTRWPALQVLKNNNNCVLVSDWK